MLRGHLKRDVDNLDINIGSYSHAGGSPLLLLAAPPEPPARPPGAGASCLLPPVAGAHPVLLHLPPLHFGQLGLGGCIVPVGTVWVLKAGGKILLYIYMYIYFFFFTRGIRL